MTLGEALGLIQHQKEKNRQRKLFLVCGFQPLHLGTFLQGHLVQRFPNEAAEIQTGLYGDLEGTLVMAAASQAEAAAVVIEWSDLDLRLGLRSAGGWALSVQPDILDSCHERFARLLGGLEALGAKMPVALVPPTLPITLLGHTAGWQWSLNELELQKQLATFLAEAARIGGVAVLHSFNLARVSPEQSRRDAMMELRAGFPYTIAHASAVASQVVKLLFPPNPMKGLITDLDETFWSGIVGEVGIPGVSWSLAEHAQIHGLYQQMLRHLSEMGVLIAVASKNELAVVEAALQREDLLMPGKLLFPVCANWGLKSDSIAEILRIWNIGAESVVFVDDSAMELDEVRTAFPAVTCLRFSEKQPAKVLELLEQLRDLFGKGAVHREDAFRHASIRANVAVQAAARDSPSGEFVHGLQGELVFDCRKNPANKRILELINKTNQFNLNGVRHSEGEWMRHLADPASIVVSVSYEDKFGPLGVICVVAGKQAGRHLEVSTWVMSCRAFSRRIEYHTLQYLFQFRGVESISLRYQATERNEPMQRFLRLVSAPEDGTERRVILREGFLEGEQDLPHRVVVREDSLQQDDGQAYPKGASTPARSS
jgi:FkbH-like protein